MHRFLFFAFTAFLCTQPLSAEWVPPSERAHQRNSARAGQEQTKIPSKWFRGAKGYEKALALQETTDADLFLYFIRPNTPDEKGLCKWFQNKGLNSQPVKKLLRQYIKVQVPLPANPKNQKLAKKFNVRKTPAVFVIQTNSWRNRCTVFHWDQKPLKLLEPDELAEVIRLNSSDKYHPAKNTLSNP